MIKIFSSGKIVHLLNKYDAFEPKPASIMLSISSAKEMKDFYEQLILNNDIKELFFYNEDKEELQSWFRSIFKIVEAAGGLVKNEKGEYLFILRNGKWDLPKGKIEKEESVENAAVREVEEECGIAGLKIIKQLPDTYHTYILKGQQILKPTYWFEMTCTDTSALTPQTEEGITDVRWIAPKDFKMIRTNTYESILDVIEGI